MGRPPNNSFGSPWLKDGTGSLERIVTNAGDKAAEMLKEASTNTFPRPLGSKRVPMDDQVMEMMAIKDDPALIANMAADREWSVETLVDYLEKMQEKLG